MHDACRRRTAPPAPQPPRHRPYERAARHRGHQPAYLDAGDRHAPGATRGQMPARTSATA
ncbi:hypothetical protein [Acidiphilium rubrum]|uniref:hypothetical protein n=1 Tax=Acidiphilium rubrum TaxID=526 RepID=UPI002C03C295|nr:hypothetical protein [Acidiphilium rubrum]HQT86266.1 hypothetical protein [Acidiphilium rubrum]HQT86351.1 hypothetical protein [Acidiphilium rubrum]